MKTIRNGVFETNSSSCHSISFSCYQNELIEFNEGKRFYFWSCSDKIEGFYTLEELYPIIVTKLNSEEFDNFKELDDYGLSNYGIDNYELPWNNYYENCEKDFIRFKQYIRKNFDFEMLKFCFDDNYENSKFCSKFILKAFFQQWFNSFGTPLMSIDNLRDTISYNTDYSDVRWYNDEKRILKMIDNSKEPTQKIQVNLDIRDN